MAHTGPRIYIVGSTLLNYELISFWLQHELHAECVYHENSPSIDMGSEDTNRPCIWLLDCFDSEKAEVELRFTDFAAIHSFRCLTALFNVERDCRLSRFVRKYKIRGLFYKNDSRLSFLKGIRTILKGDLWLSRKVLTECVHILSDEPNPLANSIKSLSTREKDVLQNVASGASNQEIAETLNISIHTVKTHLFNIYRKTNVTNRQHAALLLQGNTEPYPMGRGFSSVRLTDGG